MEADLNRAEKSRAAKSTEVCNRSVIKQYIQLLKAKLKRAGKSRAAKSTEVRRSKVHPKGHRYCYLHVY